jgi:hypothetical protein
MKKTLKRAVLGALAIGGAALLASCGGSDHNDNNTPVATTPVDLTIPPPSASATVGGFITFMKALVSSNDDVSTGLNVTAFVAPTDDTIEPDPTI